MLCACAVVLELVLFQWDEAQKIIIKKSIFYYQLSTVIISLSVFVSELYKEI